MQERSFSSKAGGYARVSKPNLVKPFLSDLFRKIGINYKEDARIDDVRVDFVVNGVAIFAGRNPEQREREILSERNVSFVSVYLPVLFENGEVTLFMDDPSFNFDYAHILPKTKKCSVMHGHTSSVLVEITGRPVDGMVIDFGEAKEIIKKKVAELDHKLFIDKKYVISIDDESASLSFNTVHGRFEIKAPRKTTVLMDGEATTENLAKYIVRGIAQEMPDNVSSVGVYVYEGMNKGAYILHRIHRGVKNG